MTAGSPEQLHRMIFVGVFDLLSWIFGPVRENRVHHPQPDTAAGFLDLAHARVRWFLSINAAYLPAAAKASGQRTYRAITVDGAAFEFSDGFTDLHTASYQHLLDAEGFGLEEARSSIGIVHAIRQAQPLGLQGDYHPLLREVLR